MKSNKKSNSNSNSNSNNNNNNNILMYGSLIIMFIILLYLLKNEHEYKKKCEENFNIVSSLQKVFDIGKINVHFE